MTAAPEIPADVMAAAEWAARSSVERPYNKGTVSRASSVIARAILAERQRCVEAVRSQVPEWVTKETGDYWDGYRDAITDTISDLCAAIQGPTT